MKDLGSSVAVVAVGIVTFAQPYGLGDINDRLVQLSVVINVNKLSFLIPSTLETVHYLPFHIFTKLKGAGCHFKRS